MSFDEVEFTPEELVILEGKDVEEEVRPQVDEYGEPIGDVPEEPQVEVSADEPEQEEVQEEAQQEQQEEPDELDQLRRANAGLLNDLRNTRGELKEARDWRRGIESRLEALAQKDAPEQVDESVEPDREEDPLEWLAWKQRQTVKEELEPIKEKDQVREEQELEKRVAEYAIASQTQYQEKEGIDEEAFNSRMGEVRENRLKWHIASGMDPTTAFQVLQQEEKAFIYDAIRRGEDPATEAMRLWKMFSGGEDEKTTPTAPTEAPDNASTFNRIEAIKKGKNTAGLGDVSGSASGNRITFEQFSRMREDDPIAQKIYGNEKLFKQISIHGEVVV
jgi:hypothetical protein